MLRQNDNIDSAIVTQEESEAPLSLVYTNNYKSDPNNNLSSEEGEIICSLNLEDTPYTLDHIHELSGNLSRVFYHPGNKDKSYRKVVKRSDTITDKRKASKSAHIALSNNPHIEYPQPDNESKGNDLDTYTVTDDPQVTVLQTQPANLIKIQPPDHKQLASIAESPIIHKNSFTAPTDTKNGPKEDAFLKYVSEQKETWYQQLWALRYYLLTLFTSARLFLSRLNRSLDGFDKSVNNNVDFPSGRLKGPHSLLAIGGLSYLIEFVIDCGIIVKHVFWPDENEKHLSRSQRFWNAFYKDERWARMLNAAVWFAVNFAAFFFTAGISGILNIAGFAFDMAHEAFREYHDVKRHEKLIAKVDKQLAEITNSLMLSVDQSLINNLNRQYNEITALSNKLNRLNKALQEVDELEDTRQDINKTKKILEADSQKNPETPNADCEKTRQKLIELKEKEKALVKQKYLSEFEEKTLKSKRNIVIHNLSTLNREFLQNKAKADHKKESGITTKIDDYFRLRTYKSKLEERVATVQAARKRSMHVALGILAGFIVFVFPQTLLFVIGASLFVRSNFWQKTEESDTAKAALAILGIVVLAAACFFPPATFALAGVATAGAIACLVLGSICGGFGRRLWMNYIKPGLSRFFNWVTDSGPHKDLCSELANIKKLDTPAAPDSPNKSSQSNNDQKAGAPSNSPVIKNLSEPGDTGLHTPKSDRGGVPRQQQEQSIPRSRSTPHSLFKLAKAEHNRSNQEIARRQSSESDSPKDKSPNSETNHSSIPITCNH